MTQAVGMQAAGIASLPPLGSLPLARGTADRGSTFRTTPDLFDRLWGTPGTRVLHLAQHRTPIQGNRLVLSPAAQVELPKNPVYLGSTVEETPDMPAGTHIVLAEHQDIVTDLSPEESWVGLRDAAASLQDSLNLALRIAIIAVGVIWLLGCLGELWRLARTTRERFA